MQKCSICFILFLCFLLSIALPVIGQENEDKEVELLKQPFRVRTSYELLKMSGEPDLGMLGMGADFFIVDKIPNLYFTINTYSAIVGKRPGLITVGTGAGYVQPLFRSPLSLDAGIFVGGGGGGGAPDGGGLITRLHLNLTYRFKHVSFFTGYSRLDFPTGEIGGNNLNAGLTFSTQFSTARKGGTLSRTDGFVDNLDLQSKLRVQVTGQNYLNFAGRPTFQSDVDAPRGGEISMLGVELDHFFHEKWYAALKLHGAVAGGIDGYMSYLVGLGFEQALGTDRLTLDTQLLAGPSGGGGIASGGGGIIQGSVGLRALVGNAYGIKAAIGQTITPGGEFNGTLLELGLSKNFQFVSTASDRKKTAYRLKDTDRLHEFGFELLNRTYYSSANSVDKNERPYDRAFNLIGLIASKKIHPHFDILGATYWAYQGSYGAYAEGLLGVRYRYEWTPSWQFRAQVMGGAAGGGGIDTGHGLVIQYSAGLAHQLNQNWGFSIGAGQMTSISGNFKPFFTDVGIIYRFATIEKQ
jgi:hypothetical protein